MGVDPVLQAVRLVRDPALEGGFIGEEMNSGFITIGGLTEWQVAGEGVKGVWQWVRGG